MSRKKGKGTKMEQKLNPLPPTPRGRGGPSSRVVADGNNSPNSSTESPPSSCVSSEGEQKQSNSLEATSMVLAGCPQCLMYVMLSEDDPQCPKCKSTVLLDFHRGGSNRTRKS
ncbi:hypothetical protein COCNU_contig69427591G000010 [Cocos nucifera]|nr:hypothetical protein [Cocos nucifera]